MDSLGPAHSGSGACDNLLAARYCCVTGLLSFPLPTLLNLTFAECLTEDFRAFCSLYERCKILVAVHQEDVSLRLPDF